MPVGANGYRVTRSLLIFSLAVTAFLLAIDMHEALAQARNPFSVGISEGGGQATGVTGWILAKQIEFERMISGAVRAVKTDSAAMWTLAGVCFAYGVFHAAGPGHGKAVVASYMLANERALKRGLIISFMAAILQGVVAISIVGILAILLNATSQRMKDAASLIEQASYAGIALLGAWLIWTKGKGLWAALNRRDAHVHDHAAHAHHDHAHHEHLDHAHDHHAHRAPALAHAGHDHHDHAHHRHDHHAHDHHDHAHHHPQPAAQKHPHGHPEHVHDEHCGHFHAPDPRTLGEGFSWGTAIATVFAAGSRPCSGAILVLVFSLAQGIFWAGIGATVAMSIGTALTTGALAAIAVFAKSLALRFTGESSPRGLIIARGFEFVAACVVCFLGVSLLLGSTAGG
jgi:nickel/cobalt exporter